MLTSVHQQQQSFSHPFAASQTSQLVSLVTNSDSEEEDENLCPICVESMDPTYRLQNERPNVIPECGHELHYACFVTVYGPLPSANKFGEVRKNPGNIGVCGVCRKPMKVGDAEMSTSNKGNKLAALTGMATPATPTLPLLNPLQKRGATSGSDFSNDDNDPIEAIDSGSASLRSANSDHILHGGAASSSVVVPIITIVPEFQNIIKSSGEVNPSIVALVTIEIPLRKDFSQRGSGFHPESPNSSRARSISTFNDNLIHSSPSYPSENDLLGPTMPNENYLPSVDDLKNRMTVADGMTASAALDRLTTLVANGRLLVRSSAVDETSTLRKVAKERLFILYLFKEALVCVHESTLAAGKEKKRGLFSSKPKRAAADNPRSELKLKGKIFVQHMEGFSDGAGGSNSLTPSPALSITIVMKERGVEDFILMFPDEATYSFWWNKLSSLLPTLDRNGTIVSEASRAQGGMPKKVLSVPDFQMNRKSNNNSSNEYGGTFSPSSSISSSPSKGQLRDHGSYSRYNSDLYPTTVISSSSNSNSITKHAPIDLLLAISLSSAQSSTTLLKTRLIKSSLQFILPTLGPKDRLSIVTFESGEGGEIRKTAFLAAGRENGRKRMEDLIEHIGSGSKNASKDHRLVQMGREEKINVVSAVNVALDVILQRKTRNTTTGMLLISDTADSINRSQMDLVLARAETANVPIHSFGYGKAHDPSPLWLISNHTHATYTFVREWYHLRECLAGVVGGMMSIAITRLKVHLTTRNNDFRIKKVSGVALALLSPDGKDVDIELKEARHGEKKELLVELELDAPEGQTDAEINDHSSSDAASSSTQSSNVQIDNRRLREILWEDGMIDEIPVVEMECSFYDPAALKSVSRLTNPILLTINLLPANSRPPPSLSAPAVVRRRMELLASDMITRSLLMVSKKNFGQAQRLIEETKQIIGTVIGSLQPQLQPSFSSRSRRDILSQETIMILESILLDVDVLLEGLDQEYREHFERDQRNYGAQQAMILRSQKSWTIRSQTERNFFRAENARILLAQSAAWA